MKPDEGLDWLRDEAAEWAATEEDYASIEVNDLMIAVLAALTERDLLRRERDELREVAQAAEAIEAALGEEAEEKGNR